MPMETKPNIIEMAKKKRHIHLLEKLQKNKTLTSAELKELAKFEGGQIAPGIVENHPQIAKAFKVTVRTVRNWAAEGMPVMPDGKYDITDIQAWRLTRSDKKGAKKKEEGEDHDVAYRKFKALLAEIDYKKQLGELLPKEEVEAGRVERILAVKTAFLALPQEVAPQLVGLEPRQIQTVLDQRIKEIMETFAQDKKDKSNDRSHDDGALVKRGAHGLAPSGKDNGIAVGG